MGGWRLEKTKKQPDMIKHFSLKCGLSNNLDYTGVGQIKIRGIEDCTILSAEREFTLNLTESDSELEPH